MRTKFVCVDGFIPTQFELFGALLWLEQFFHNNNTNNSHSPARNGNVIISAVLRNEEINRMTCHIYHVKAYPTSAQDSLDHSLGKLLLQLGFLDENHLEDLLAISNETNTSLVKVGFQAGYLDEEEISSLVFCQWHLRKGNLNLETAQEALKLAKLTGKPLKAALSDVTYNAQKISRTRLLQALNG